MAILGVGFLLYGYRLVGQSAVADEKYDAVRSGYRIVGWCMVVMAIIALLSRLLDEAW
jgi:hypothetical protein